MSEMTKVVSKCANCGKLDEFEVPQSGLQARSKGVTCTYCIHGEHELPIPKGETCTCTCHGLPQEVVVQ